MVALAIEDPGWTVDELAARAGLPVRTIREYQTLRVLEPPERRGRLGFYGEAHLRRLRLIGRLQSRGYSLAGIRDLLEAWAAGGDLLGVLQDPETPLLDEAPAVLDRVALGAALPEVPAKRLHELVALGVVTECGSEQFCVPSPSLLRVIGDATGAGVPVDDVFALISEITAGVRGIADAVADFLVRNLDGRVGDEATLQLLRRGRGLIAQGTGRLLIHELGRALVEPDRDLAGLVDRLRLGSITLGPAASE